MPGEFDIIRDYFSRPPRRPEVALGVGDDAALIMPPPGQQLAVSIDTLVAGVHFPDYAAPEDIGWKSLAVSLSDLAAMGAEPAGFTLAITLPSVDEAWLARFASGLFELADRCAVDLVGGDTTRGPLSISVQAHGWVPANAALRRKGAQAGDLVCVTGTLGDAALALALGREAPPELAARLHRPTPRIGAGLALRELATAAIDLSDGLAGDLPHILKASGVGARVEAARLPQSKAFADLCGGSSFHYQATGGDDYEICFCMPSRHLETVQAEIDVAVTVIGQVTADAALVWQDAQGHAVELPASGYDHFRNE